MCNLSTGVYNKGIMEGKAEQARETAYKLLDMGMPIDKIASLVEFNIDTIQEWFAKRDEMLVK